MKPVLICRPQPGAEATAKRACSLGLRPLIYALSKIQPLEWVAPDPGLFDAVMITSANAVRHGGDVLSHYHSLPLFAVGQATAQAAAEAGFSDIYVGNEGAQALIHHIHSTNYKNILHLCGAAVSPYAFSQLRVEQVAVYHAMDTGNAQGLADLLVDRPVILVHSPRMGDRLAGLIAEPHRSSLCIAAISTAALDACGAGWREGRSVELPKDELVLALARQMCQL